MNICTSMQAMLKRINGIMRDKCFSRSDFADLGNRLQISQGLSRLERDGTLVSPLRGYYCRPRFSKLLKEPLPPDYNELANAIARNYGWSTLPCGDILLNELGLSTQVPIVWSYVSTGPYRRYSVNGTILTFKHTANREMFNMSRKSAMIVQALKAMGKNNISIDSIEKLRRAIDPAETRKLVDETTRTTSWIFETIKTIVEGC